jgi:multiple sugar transport system ATP-binding protein
VDDGSVSIGGQIVDDVPPRDRDIAMVFQNYALYPYMTVYENIAFGMRMRKLPEDEVRTQVQWAARMLGIEPLLGREPRQLSGGQRQRVAIGRAMVRRPQLFLFDEPLSNLDAQLREGMRGEIKRLHQTLRITTVYVTHDQIEAMTLADRVVLMNQGTIEQQGPPMALYERPANRFVAGFLGSPAINFLDARLRRDGARCALVLADGSSLALPDSRAAAITAADGTAVTLGLRPEHFVLAGGEQLSPGRSEDSCAPPRGADTVPGGRGPTSTGVVRSAVGMLQPAGPRVHASLTLAGTPVTAEFSSRDGVAEGSSVDVRLDLERAVLLDGASGLALDSGAPR